MPKFIVPLTVLVSITVEADDKATAIDEARRFVELGMPEDGYVDGWNDVQRQNGAPIIHEVAGYECESVELDEVEIDDA